MSLSRRTTFYNNLKLNEDKNMMTSQNLDILRLKLAFRLEKNCQCIPDLDIHEWYSYQHKSLINVYNRCKSVLDSRVTLLGIYQPSILSSYLKFCAVCSSGTVKTETEKIYSPILFLTFRLAMNAKLHQKIQ